jgi:class 3 adenylate cyclase
MSRYNLKTVPTDPEKPPANEAVMVHVLFMDIVGASKRFTDDQPRMVKDLQNKVSQTVEYQRAHGCNQLIAIPTGDGMALVFLDKMESPVRCSMELACALRREESYKVRMGIHSGPVFIVEDINGQRNVSGAGINRAQRVMDCGDGDHILLSDTIAESLRQFREWNVALKDIGECQVKDGWQHVWSFEDGNCGNRVLPKKSKHYVMRSRRMLIMGGLAALVLAAVLGAWLVFRPAPAATSAVVQPSVETSISYSIIVKKSSGEKLVMSKEIAFDAGDGIKIELQPTLSGYLYLINEGPQNAGQRTWSWLFPYPKVREGSAEVEAGQIVFSPEGKSQYFEFDKKSGAETIFVVWSSKPVPELEQLRTTMFANSEVKFSADQARRAQAVLENASQVTAVANGNSTTLSTFGPYVVKKIVLTHL